MKAMLFAAGLGTRLRPFTNDRPKALVEVNGAPLLEIAVRRLKAAGCEELIVNVHHFAEQIVGFLKKKDHFGIHIAVSDERDLLLDTGGALKKAAWFFDDGQPFLVCNVDALTDLPLLPLYQQHLRSGALATLAIRHRKTSRYFLFDENNQLCGWRNVKTGETLWCKENQPERMATSHRAVEWAFSGIHAISPAIFGLLPEKEVFSFIEVYLKAGGTCRIEGYIHDEGYWLDVGTPESLARASQLMADLDDLKK